MISIWINHQQFREFSKLRWMAYDDLSYFDTSQHDRNHLIYNNSFSIDKIVTAKATELKYQSIMTHILQAHISKINTNGPLFNMELLDLREFDKCDDSHNRKQYWYNN